MFMGLRESGKRRLLASSPRIYAARIDRPLDRLPVRSSHAGCLSAVVADLVHAEARELAGVARALASSSGCTVLVLDEYEAFRLLDTWFRQVFIPSLSDQTRIVLLTKLPPSLG